MIVEEKQWVSYEIGRNWGHYIKPAEGEFGEEYLLPVENWIVRFLWFFLVLFFVFLKTGWLCLYTHTHTHIKLRKNKSRLSSKSFIGNLLHRNEVSALDICRRMLIVGLFDMSKSKRQNAHRYDWLRDIQVTGRYAATLYQYQRLIA